MARGDGLGMGNALRVVVHSAKVSILPRVIARVRRVFDLAADPLAIAAHLSADPALAPLVRQRPGLRVPGAWDGFELAIRAVLGQQITVPAAIRLAGKLVAGYDASLSCPEDMLILGAHAFRQRIVGPGSKVRPWRAYAAQHLWSVPLQGTAEPRLNARASPSFRTGLPATSARHARNAGPAHASSYP